MVRWLGLVVLVLGCGGNSVQHVADATGGSSAGGQGGGAGQPSGAAGQPSHTAGMGGSAGQAPPEETNQDEAILNGCKTKSPCPTSISQLIENSQYYVSVETECLLDALARREVGRYVHDTSAVASDAGTGALHTLVVTEGGDVLYARVGYYYVDGVNTVPLDEGQRCTLRPKEYFESCLAGLDEGEPLRRDDLGWACAFGDGDYSKPTTLDWFDGCETESPIACE